MQTLNEIRQMLEEFGLAPQKRFGQNFLFDHNLLAKIVALAELDGSQTVLEVGPGTGSLTEELLQRAAKVVAVEIDSGLYRLLSQRFEGKSNLALIHDDALSGKHALSPSLIEALGSRAFLVSNLPYNVATPLVAQCLVSSWQAISGQLGAVLFERLVFTVQQEVADRLIAKSDTWEYGPVSVIISLLGKAKYGPAIPNTAFWPKPQIVSRAVRIDFDATEAQKLKDILALKALLSMVFNQRRKQIASAAKRGNAVFAEADFVAALDEAGIGHTMRPQQVSPQQFRAAANALAGKLKAPGENLDAPKGK